jgi:Fe-Mn family superoxide dismutase
MAFTLPALPYRADALEPHIDKQTMEIHHGKHHNAYVTNLNAALEKHPELQSKSIDDLLKTSTPCPKRIRTAVRNNGGGHANHRCSGRSWARSAAARRPARLPMRSIRRSAASTSSRKSEEGRRRPFRQRLGVGHRQRRQADHRKLANQDSPVMEGKTVVFGIDVWEHAYYLKYQNRRPDYIDAWWNVRQLGEVNKRLASRQARRQGRLGQARNTGLRVHLLPAPRPPFMPAPPALPARLP